jgi:hypothetical protein
VLLWAVLGRRLRQQLLRRVIPRATAACVSGHVSFAVASCR